MSNASQRDEPGSAPDNAAEEQSGLREIFSSPVHVAFFVACLIVGATLSYLLVEGDLSGPRRIVGGAIVGGFGWLLAMVHRII
jgi:hypothetical protein